MANALRILGEERIGLEAVCELLGCSMTTAYRACRLHGLEHLHTGPQRGGKIITSVEAVERYLAKLNGIDLDSSGLDEASPASATKARQRELERVDRELAAAGYQVR